MKNLAEIVNKTKFMKLLYVEDNKAVRETSIMILSDIFAEIIVAVDGKDGIEKFYDNNDIDIIISDISMPIMNGLDMAESIRNFDKDIQILLLSAYNKTKYFTKGIDLNIDSYLLKPLQLPKLLQSLKKIIKKIEFLKEFNNNLLELEQYKELLNEYASVTKANTLGVITFVNDEFCKLSGYAREELIDVNHNIIRHPDNSAAIYTDIWHTIKQEKKTWRGIIRNITKDKQTYYADSLIKPILNHDNTILEYVSIKRNITDIMNPKKQFHDFIHSSKKPMIVMVQIEDFSNIESFYGHSLSQKLNDDFAKELLRYMPDSIKFNKFLSLGDGQFIFLFDIENMQRVSVDMMIEDLQNYQFIMNGLNIDIDEIGYDISIFMSISIGDNCIQNVKYGIQELKRSKRSFIVANDFFIKEQEKAANNLKILKMIRLAIDHDNIVSYFQAIVSNATTQIVKYESLVRLINSEGEVISPYMFLDIAKQGIYYSQITSIVLENSFAALDKTDKSISINISVLDIEKLSTREKIYELLSLNKESSSRVVFELLEDENVKDLDEISSFILKVKEYGVKIAIDDFGVGYSNFERLFKYHPDILKIDGSLIRNIETDSYSLSVVKTIVAFAKEQNIELVAEYIENETIFNIVKGLGVEYSQGYYFSKPEAILV